MSVWRNHRWLWYGFGLSLAAVVAAGVWWCWNRRLSEQADPSPVEYPVRGIDISAHNGKIDFGKLGGSGVRFAYVKATEGGDFIDRNFRANALGLDSAGIPWGAYHFFRFDTDGELQGRHLVRALRGLQCQLPPAIDVEEWGNPADVTRGKVTANLRLMVDLLRREGYSPVIYTNKKGYNRFVKGRFGDCPLWICSFTDPPLDKGEEWAIWQYSHRGTVAGISGNVDMNTLNPRSAPIYTAIR